MAGDAIIRNRLIERIRGLTHESLVAVAEFVEQLEHRNTEKSKVAASRRTPNQSGVKPPQSKDWPHAPLHRIGEHGTYIVTAGTLHKEHYFRGSDRLSLLESKLLELAMEFRWHLEAWAVFSNHYHFVAHSGPDSGHLNTFLGTLHTATATVVNRLDRAAERQVWFNFWETQLTYEKSYLARLNYVHQNAVKHGLVRVANQYPWCSAAWFERTATPAQVKTIYSFKTDKVKVLDDFEVIV